MRTMITGKALEVVTRKDKNDETKVFNTLVVYEPGKQYPDLLKVNLKPEQLRAAETMVGNDVAIEADVMIFKNGASMNFVSGRVLTSKAA